MTAYELLLTQLRVLGALVMRETRITFGHVQLGYLWAIFNPVVGIAMMVAIFSFISPHPPLGTNFPLFFGTGMLSFTYYTKLTSSLMSAISANRPMLNYPLVKTTDVIFARFILIAVTNFLIMLIFFSALSLSYDDVGFPPHIDGVIGATFFISLLGLGIGIINLVIISFWKTWGQIEGLLSRPLFFMSGIFFLPSNFTPEVQYWLSWNPVLHCIEWMREGFYINYQSTILDKQYLIQFVVIAVFLGILSERLYRKHLV